MKDDTTKQDRFTMPTAEEIAAWEENFNPIWGPALERMTRLIKAVRVQRRALEDHVGNLLANSISEEGVQQLVSTMIRDAIADLTKEGVL